MSYRRFPLYHSQVSFRRGIAIYTPTPIFPLPSPLVPYIPPGLPPISSSPPPNLAVPACLSSPPPYSPITPHFSPPPIPSPTFHPLHPFPPSRPSQITPQPTNQPIALPHTNIPHHPTLPYPTLPRPARFVKRTHRDGPTRSGISNLIRSTHLPRASTCPPLLPPFPFLLPSGPPEASLILCDVLGISWGCAGDGGADGCGRVGLGWD